MTENKNLKELLKLLKEEAQELINLGNSNEKAQGYGMMKVIECVTQFKF
jgi:succinate dehydrogenase flavin-adding protein (antitoxin of CptAB toxin-antitoxin module)